MPVLEVEQHDRRHHRNIAENADEGAEQSLGGLIERSQFRDLRRGGTGQAQCGQTGVPTGGGQTGS